MLNLLSYFVKNEVKRVFAGCGNGVIYNFDLEHKTLIVIYPLIHSVYRLIQHEYLKKKRTNTTLIMNVFIK
jgi:hypothetical protein